MRKTAAQIAEEVLNKIALAPNRQSNKVSTKPSSFELRQPLNTGDDEAPVGLLVGRLNEIDDPPQRKGESNSSSRSISARLNAPTSWGATTSLPSTVSNSPILGQF